MSMAFSDADGGTLYLLDGTRYPRRRRHLGSVHRRRSPYKKGNALSTTFKIMSGITRDGHIDIDLFNLMLCYDVFRRYADQ